MKRVGKLGKFTPKKSYEIDPGFVYKQENLIISVFVGN
jgi:hypothetical protein